MYLLGLVFLLLIVVYLGKKEAYENCYLRWGVKRTECPYEHACPLRRTCMRGDPNAGSMIYR